MTSDPRQRSRAPLGDGGLPIEPDEATLIAAARAGDRAAFARLFRRHADTVRTHLTRLVGAVPEREDLLQGVFLSLHRGLAHYRGEGSLSTFLHRVTVNTATDHLRRRRSRGAVQAPLQDADLPGAGSGGPHPEACVEARADLLRLSRLLDRIAAKKRIAFVLVAVEGRSLAEAAELVGAREQAVKQRVLKARRELLALMAEEDQGAISTARGSKP